MSEDSSLFLYHKMLKYEKDKCLFFLCSFFFFITACEKKTTSVKDSDGVVVTDAALKNIFIQPL